MPLSNNAIAKYLYLPCIQYQNQTAAAYGWRAATRIYGIPIFKVTEFQNRAYFAKKKTFSTNICF